MLSEKERILIPEIMEGAIRLPEEKQERLLWMIQGMLWGEKNVHRESSNKIA